MEITAKLDSNASKIAQKLVFSCEYFVLQRDDIVQLKNKKFINFVKEDELPETIPCQVLIFVEGVKAKFILFNPSVVIEFKDESFLNKDIIERTKENGWFWIEFTVPLYEKCVKLNLNFNI